MSILFVGPVVSQGTAQTSDSVCDGLVEALSLLLSLPQSRKVNTWIKFCPRSSLQITERGFPPVHIHTSNNIK